MHYFPFDEIQYMNEGAILQETLLSFLICHFRYIIRSIYSKKFINEYVPNRVIPTTQVKNNYK